MQAQPEFGFEQLFTHIVGDIASALSERSGENQQQRATRMQGAVHTIMGFLPRDVIEAMLAGHCVMFHELMADSTRGTLRGEMDTLHRATRANIVAMDKAFTSNLDRLERYQNRPADGRRDAPEERLAAAKPVHKPVAPAEAPKPAQAARPTQRPPASVPPPPSEADPPMEAIRMAPAPGPSELAFLPDTRIPSCLASPVAAQAALLALDLGRFKLGATTCPARVVLPPLVPNGHAKTPGQKSVP